MVVAAMSDDFLATKDEMWACGDVVWWMKIAVHEVVVCRQCTQLYFSGLFLWFVPLHVSFHIGRQYSYNVLPGSLL
ncbi:hypothetical protein vseg_006174 [Gypsophila vaccaria]